jgi:hypothetical protein
MYAFKRNCNNFNLKKFKFNKLHLFAYVYRGLIDFVVVPGANKVNVAVLAERAPLRIDYHLWEIKKIIN